MTIERVELTNFRSYESRAFTLHPAATLVVGPNASGKTNLLESLYVLASTKSFRARDRDLVRHGADHFRIVAATSEEELAYGLSTARGGIEKRVTHDGTRLALSRHIGSLQVTLFEPTDLELVSGPPDGRRRYLDFLLCQTDPRYLKVLQDYRRVLKQRNALLDGERPIGVIRDEIFSWDIKLTELAVEIYSRRKQLIGSLNGALPSLYADIAGHRVDVAFDYLPSVVGAEYADGFMAALARNLPRDLGAGFTTIGPHREDFAVRFKGSEIAAVASRGETRTVVLAAKLAELSYAEAVTGRRPLLLLDDVFSELDRDRRTYLLHRLSGYQTVITTTDADAVTREIQTGHDIIHTGDHTTTEGIATSHEKPAGASVEAEADNRANRDPKNSKIDATAEFAATKKPALEGGGLQVQADA